MNNYDLMLSDTKRAVVNILCAAVRKEDWALEQLPGMIDQLNEAWDKLTDCLVRQRDERGRQIERLMDELAEARKS